MEVLSIAAGTGDIGSDDLHTMLFLDLFDSSADLLLIVRFDLCGTELIDGMTDLLLEKIVGLILLTEVPELVFLLGLA